MNFILCGSHDEAYLLTHIIRRESDLTLRIKSICHNFVFSSLNAASRDINLLKTSGFFTYNQV